MLASRAWACGQMVRVIDWVGGARLLRCMLRTCDKASVHGLHHYCMIYMIVCNRLRCLCDALASHRPQRLESEGTASVFSRIPEIIFIVFPWLLLYNSFRHESIYAASYSALSVLRASLPPPTFRVCATLAHYSSIRHWCSCCIMSFSICSRSGTPRTTSSDTLAIANLAHQQVSSSSRGADHKLTGSTCPAPTGSWHPPMTATLRCRAPA
jgi:hypothetical protein